MNFFIILSSLLLIVGCQFRGPQGNQGPAGPAGADGPSSTGSIAQNHVLVKDSDGNIIAHQINSSIFQLNNSDYIRLYVANYSNNPTSLFGFWAVGIDVSGFTSFSCEFASSDCSGPCYSKNTPYLKIPIGSLYIAYSQGAYGPSGPNVDRIFRYQGDSLENNVNIQSLLTANPSGVQCQTESKVFNEAYPFTNVTETYQLPDFKNATVSFE